MRLFHVWLQPAFAVKVLPAVRFGLKSEPCQMALMPCPALNRMMLFVIRFAGGTY